MTAGDSSANNISLQQINYMYIYQHNITFMPTILV